MKKLGADPIKVAQKMDAHHSTPVYRGPQNDPHDPDRFKPKASPNSEKTITKAQQDVRKITGHSAHAEIDNRDKDDGRPHLPKPVSPEVEQRHDQKVLKTAQKDLDKITGQKVQGVVRKEARVSKVIEKHERMADERRPK